MALLTGLGDVVSIGPLTFNRDAAGNLTPTSATQKKIDAAAASGPLPSTSGVKVKYGTAAPLTFVPFLPKPIDPRTGITLPAGYQAQPLPPAASNNQKWWLLGLGGAALGLFFLVRRRRAA